MTARYTRVPSQTSLELLLKENNKIAFLVVKINLVYKKNAIY